MFNIALFQPQIPPNTGNVARLCVGANCKLHLIRPLGFFIDDKTMKRAGCDYWDDLDLQIHDSLDELYKYAGDASFYYITKFAEKSYTDAKFKEGDYLIFGSEQHGLPEEVRQANEEACLSIPMPGPVRSINLSNAVSIVLYEAVRQNLHSSV